jgi:CHASE3 domain sensor protein
LTWAHRHPRFAARGEESYLTEHIAHPADHFSAPLDIVSLRRYRRWLIALFLVVPVALGALLWASVRLNGAVREVDRSHEAIDAIISARAAARQSRVALHAYLQTGVDEHLASYERAATTAWNESWRFKEMTLENREQAANAQRFEQRLGEMFKLGDELLAEKKAGRPRSTEARAAAEAAVSDGLRKALSAVIDEERGHVAVHERELSSSVRALQLLSILFAAVVTVFGYRSMRRVDKLLTILTRP